MSDQHLVLGFDTSGPYISAVLLRGTEVLSDTHEDMARGQGEALFPVLEALLQRAGADWQSLDAIGVGVGPGNFTGIRISVSAARGLALSLGVPVVGVSLLEAVAFGTQTPVLACLSAPRDQVYVSGHGTRSSIAAQFLPVSDLPMDWAEPDLTCVGSAAETVAERLGATVQPAVYTPGSAVARIAALRWQSNPPPPAPLYLKAADAAPARDAPPVILDQ